MILVKKHVAWVPVHLMCLKFTAYLKESIPVFCKVGFAPVSPLLRPGPGDDSQAVIKDKQDIECN